MNLVGWQVYSQILHVSHARTHFMLPTHSDASPPFNHMHDTSTELETQKRAKLKISIATISKEYSWMNLQYCKLNMHLMTGKVVDDKWQ